MHASAIPYWVGTKNVLVVTWLTTTNLYFGCLPNTSLDPPDEPLEALDPQAASSELAPPTAAPVIAVRRRNARRSNPGLSAWA